MRWILVLVVALGIAGPSNADPTSEFTEFLRESRELLAEYLRTVDPAEYDVAARASKLGRDPQASFEFVRDEIAYEVYAGALRGAAGCLGAKAGNAVDKSLLLAALLAASGHETRWAFGTLDQETAGLLAASTLENEPDEEDVEIDFPYF